MKKFIVLDTETAGGLDNPMVYDLGWVVTDKNGTIYEQRSFCLSDIFLNKDDSDFLLSEDMKTAYYAEKLPKYIKAIKSGNGDWKLSSFYNARQALLKDMKDYNVKKIYAYNAQFDRNALNNTMNVVTNGKYHFFMPYGTEWGCIWNLATSLICNNRNFCKWAIENKEFNTKTNNVKTSAETVYRYLTNEPKFIEDHTGLSDVLIETYILVKCFKKKKKMNDKISRLAWKTPQAKFKKIIAKGK